MQDASTHADPAGRSRPLALIAAGGEGRRLGSVGPKALVDCAGRPLLEWCLDAFVASETFGGGAGVVVVAAHSSELAAFEAACDPARAAGLELHITPGGSSRSHSVAAALRVGAAAADGDGFVFVHDAARIHATAELIDELADRMQLLSAECDGLLVARAVTDTIKLVDDQMTVHSTPPRERLWAVQTPQVFRREALQAALGVTEEVSDELLAAATDDASLIEARGGQIKLFEWAGHNEKVTTAQDLAAAQRLLSRSGS